MRACEWLLMHDLVVPSSSKMTLLKKCMKVINKAVDLNIDLMPVDLNSLYSKVLLGIWKKIKAGNCLHRLISSRNLES